jgi:putative colanic acid biosynthesis acetyltransferase WcaF
MVQAMLFRSSLPGSSWRAALLRAFGARIGRGVVIKPGVTVTFPWKLAVGDFSWLGERVWIDNLADVWIGSHCCISQGAYLCTGNHRWDAAAFDLAAAPIRIEAQCWIGAMARVGPGVTCGEGAVLTLGSVATADLAEWRIYGGNPAVEVRQRPRPAEA